jgi:hypothetical protein
MSLFSIQTAILIASIKMSTRRAQREKRERKRCSRAGGLPPPPFSSGERASASSAICVTAAEAGVKRALLIKNYYFYLSCCISVGEMLWRARRVFYNQRVSSCDGELNRCKQKSCLAVAVASDIKFLIAIFNCSKWQSRTTSFRDFEIKFCSLTHAK